MEIINAWSNEHVQPVTDEGSGITYIPCSNGWAVGFKIEYPSGKVGFIERATITSCQRKTTLGRFSVTAITRAGSRDDKPLAIRRNSHSS